MVALHRGQITPAQAFAPKGVDVPAPCTAEARAATAAEYAEAAAWLRGQSQAPVALREIHARMLATKSPCHLASLRRQFLAAAITAGFEPRLPNPAVPAAVELRRQCPDTSHAYLVGKGPSLDQITPEAFPDATAPILCCNESVHAIEALDLPNPVFCVQQDARLGPRCRPAKGTWFPSAKAFAAGDGPTHPRCVPYDAAGVGGRPTSLTASQALRILRHARGFATVTAYGFDGATHGGPGYARVVGSDPAEWDPRIDRFARSAKTLRQVAKDCHLALDLVHVGWTVACVLRTGGQYTPAHVAWLRDQVAARIRTPHRFVCLSDIPDHVPGGIPLQHDWPGWWSKPELFRPGLFHGPTLFLDLDVVLTADIDLPHVSALDPAAIHAAEDWWRKGEIQGSVMAWRADAGREIYATMAADPAVTMARYHAHGDQALVSACVPRADLPFPVRSYKAHGDQAHATASVMVFHGDPKPWAVSAPWIPLLDFPSRRAEWLVRTIKEHGYTSYCEVGVKEGKTLACVALHCPDCQIYAIDAWQPQQTTGPEDYAAWDFDHIRNDYFRRVAPSGTRVRTLILDALDAATLLPPVDIAFLDADHGTEPTLAAIRAYLPRIRPGGILAGHDIDWPTVRAALDQSGLDYRTAPDNVWHCTVPLTPTAQEAASA